MFERLCEHVFGKFMSNARAFEGDFEAARIKYDTWGYVIYFFYDRDYAVLVFYCGRMHQSVYITHKFSD